MALPVDICNWALLRLGENRVNSIDPPYSNGNSSIPATLAFLFPLVRDAELREHPWSFASARVTLAADATAPAFGYDARFALPSDFLRLVNEDQEDWKVEGRYILSNCDGPIDVPYIQRVSDSEFFDPLFNAALSCQLALNLAEKLTTSNVKKQLIKDDYDTAIAKAKRTNAIEKPAANPPEDTFVTARR